jgi:hypothetical protein
MTIMPERAMTLMRLVIQLTWIALVTSVALYASAQSRPVIPKIDRESLKGIDPGSVGTGAGWEMPVIQPKEEKPSIGLTPEQAAELKKLAGAKEQPTFEPPVIKDDGVQHYD